MINLVWAVSAAILSGFGMSLLKVHWSISFIMGLMVGIVIFFILGRKMQEKIQNLMNQVQKEMQNQKLERAIDVLKSGYKYKWHQLFLEKQLNSQIGTIYYVQKKEDKALDYLNKGFFKHFIGQGMLAAIFYKRKDFDKVKEIMDTTIKSNKKESIVYALYAYFLDGMKDREGAIAMLQKGLKKMPNDEKLTSNLLLLQNNKKMKMKVYGEMWLQFMLERAPRMMQQNQPKHMRFSKKALFRG